jgi:hypothetical protein
MIDVMGIDPGSTWWWGGWPLLYSRASTCVASDAIDHPAYPYGGMDYHQDPTWSYLLERFGTTEVC